MVKILIKDLKKNETVDSVFIIKLKELRKTKTGSEYLNLKLIDCSGEIEAKYWEGFKDFLDQTDNQSIVRVFAEVGEYNSKPQLTIKKARIAEDSEYDLSDLIAHTKKNIDEMFENIKALVLSFTDDDLKTLLNSFFSDEQFSAKFKKAPAAVSMHSACIGGLLEHVSNLVNLALYVSSEYENIDRDLLLTGVILHDIGKTTELEYQAAFKYSDRGKLVGHITMGTVMLNEKIKELEEFPEEKKVKLEHMILSHHGVPEFGSPRQPMTLEAAILFYLDNLDAKIIGFNEFVAKNPPTDSGWTSKAYMFDNRELFLGKKSDNFS